MAKLYFVTNSEEKFKELQDIVKGDGIALARYPLKIHESQDDDIHSLVRNKAFEAFKVIRRPLLVEHTMLKLDALNQLPGSQTNYIYSRIGHSTLVKFCKNEGNFGASAESVFCYCDGTKYEIVEAEERGMIKKTGSLKDDAFAWDKIFIPEKDNDKRETYAEMDYEKKNSRSMRRKAWDALKEKLGKEFLETYRLSSDEGSTAAVQSEADFTELAELIKQKKVMLFIGAGISKAVNMPLWNELIQKLIGGAYDQSLFETYGDNMMLAEYIKQQQGRDVYQKIEKILTIDDTIRAQLYNSEIYRAIMELDCPVIYTTNFDHLIEEYYREKRGEGSYSKVVGIEDMYKVKSGATRIMKFHGDISDDDSIVLTESEYFSRMDFQDFMDVQLQADMLSYHILFLGYSLSDINIKMLLYMARKRQKTKSAMKSFIFTATPNVIQKAVFEANQITTLWGVEADKKKGTQDFLIRLAQCVNSD